MLCWSISYGLSFWEVGKRIKLRHLAWMMSKSTKKFFRFRSTIDMDSRESLPFAEAIAEINTGMSTRAAALKYGIPRTTLLNHKNNPLVRKNGRPPALSENDESTIADMIISCSEFKIELDQLKFAEVLAEAARDRGGFVVNLAINDHLLLSIVAHGLIYGHFIQHVHF